ncbi:hypothetical protein LAZ67_17003051 [Cordylochernes scorpioides]|uniref:RNA-directed DNA polymerase n=1 Tax=Cordylochernes scorpioides TaxID=51811 RepID=A0ABY6LEH3_9ARAC|nr:hypothetical protein LAZ67_17003051 [Cordylochernes scorpioides]
MYQLDAPLSPLTYHFAVLPERCTYWECQADLCKAHTIFPPSANNTQYAHFSDNTSTTQGLTQPPHHVQSKNFFRANCSYYRVKVPEQPPNANLSHPTKVQTDHLHHTPKHPHSTHPSMYHTHHPLSPEHLPGIPIDNQPQPPYPPQFPALLRQYQHVFSRNKFAVPCLKVPPVRIATNSDKVVTIRPYRVPICDQREIRSQIRQMLDNDIIEPSYSPFSSPVTLVTKRDKTKRFCIDYRKVNEVISSDVHPLPRIEDILDRLARAKYFSTADVSSAYWQVPIHPDSRPLLAFATIDGLYQPTRLPFGLKTSPQIYERAINQVLQGHGLDCVAHYFDDFVIYSETLEEHQEHLRRFFAFCDAENLQLNLTKCEFFRQTIEFLGYTITAGTTTPLIRNTDVIHAIPPPNNRKTLQSFLGAVNVYNKFIPDYARLRTPLNNLLKKDVTWDWDDKCQKAFTSLKESLTQHPVLHLYKDELPCQVYCDASTLGIAGVLKQVHSAGKAYPVQYFSRALRVHERNYTISELECLAIVESVEKFRVYLMGRKFTIFSDHHALQWLKTIKNPSGRLFRWSLRLSCYEYEVRYIKGSLQHEADLLSRNPFCGFLDATIIKNHQLTPSGESKLTIDRNGLQTLKRRGVTKIVVPDALVPDLLTKVHNRYNHPGISQMTRLISTQYYWKGMSEDISKTTKACAICQSTKPPRGPTFGELGQLPVATQPFDLVALDTIAGLAKYGNAKAYLHVVVDHFSRYTWTFPSKSTSLTTYQQVIKRVLQDGSPKRLLTDRAPAFTSPKFRKFLINRNIQPLLTTSNNPQANGLCERLNATLTGKLRLLHLENPKAAWTKLAKRVTVVYNNTPHSVTGFPPGYLMFGVLPPELTEHVNPYPVLTTARRIAHERTQAKHLKDKHAYDQQHKTPHFEPGDLVLVKVYHHPNTGKLAPYFTGPYEILEIISPNVVRINRPNQPLNRNTDTVHVNKLQYYNENIRYIAPPTLIPHPAKPQSRTLPPLFEHLTPDLFTVERFAPTIGNCTTTTPVDPQCNIIAQRDIPQPAISRPTHITKVKTPIPTVRADPKPIPLQARFFRNVKTFPLFHLLYLINLFILPTVLLPMATLLYVSVYTLQPNRLFQLQEALFEITIAVVELIQRTIGIILPELWTILVHSHALVALIELNVLRDSDVRPSFFPAKFTIMADRDRGPIKGQAGSHMTQARGRGNNPEEPVNVQPAHGPSTSIGPTNPQVINIPEEPVNVQPAHEPTTSNGPTNPQVIIIQSSMFANRNTLDNAEIVNIRSYGGDPYGNLPIVKVNINGNMWHLLYDTGSQVSIIDSEKCKVLKENWDDALKTLRIVSVTGQEQTLTRVKTCRVGNENGIELGEIRFWLMSLGDKAYDGILGINDIRRFNIPLPAIRERCNMISLKPEDRDYVDLSYVASVHRPMVSSSFEEKSVKRIENEAVKLPPTEFNRSCKGDCQTVYVRGDLVMLAVPKTEGYSNVYGPFRVEARVSDVNFRSHPSESNTGAEQAANQHQSELTGQCSHPTVEDLTNAEPPYYAHCSLRVLSVQPLPDQPLEALWWLCEMCYRVTSYIDRAIPSICVSCKSKKSRLILLVNLVLLDGEKMREVQLWGDNAEKFFHGLSPAMVASDPRQFSSLLSRLLTDLPILDCCLYNQPYRNQDPKTFLDQTTNPTFDLALVTIAHQDRELPCHGHDNHGSTRYLCKFEDAELQALLDEDSTQMQEKLAKQLRVSQAMADYELEQRAKQDSRLMEAKAKAKARRENIDISLMEIREKVNQQRITIQESISSIICLSAASSLSSPAMTMVENL